MTDFAATLAAMSACRDAMIQITSSHDTRHPLYREAVWLMKDIDNLAGIITGRSDHFHLKGHSINVGKPSTG